MTGDGTVSHNPQGAPLPLEHVRAFVNTHDLEKGTDAVATPGALAHWFVARGLLPEPPEVGEDEHALALRVRAALRAYLLVNGGHEADPGAPEVINEAAARCGLQLQFTLDGGAVVPAGRSGALDGLGRLLAIVAGAMADGTWARLKACQHPQCEWAFYDHARNRSGKWCSMEVCGNRMKAKNFRARHGAGAR